jgi:hypothetical protein
LEPGAYHTEASDQFSPAAKKTSKRCVAGLDHSALTFPEKRCSDLRSACGDDSGRNSMGFFNVQKGDAPLFHPVALNLHHLHGPSIPYVFFDLLDLDGLDFPKPI